MNRGFEKETARDLLVGGPDRLEQLATIHFDVRAVGRGGLQQFLDAPVDGRKTAIEANLKNRARPLGCFQHLARGVERGGHGFLAKYVLSGGDGFLRQVGVQRVGRGDVDGVDAGE